MDLLIFPLDDPYKLSFRKSRYTTGNIFGRLLKNIKERRGLDCFMMCCRGCNNRKCVPESQVVLTLDECAVKITLSAQED